MFDYLPSFFTRLWTSSQAKTTTSEPRRVCSATVTTNLSDEDSYQATQTDNPRYQAVSKARKIALCSDQSAHYKDDSSSESSYGTASESSLSIEPSKPKTFLDTLVKKPTPEFSETDNVPEDIVFSKIRKFIYKKKEKK